MAVDGSKRYLCCLGLNGHFFLAAGTYILLNMILSSKIYTETVSIAFYVVKWDILSSRMKSLASLYPAVKLVLCQRTYDMQRMPYLALT